MRVLYSKDSSCYGVTPWKAGKTPPQIMPPSWKLVVHHHFRYSLHSSLRFIPYKGPYCNARTRRAEAARRCAPRLSCSRRCVFVCSCARFAAAGVLLACGGRREACLARLRLLRNTPGGTRRRAAVSCRRLALAALSSAACLEKHVYTFSLAFERYHKAVQITVAAERNKCL